MPDMPQKRLSAQEVPRNTLVLIVPGNQVEGLEVFNSHGAITDYGGFKAGWKASGRRSDLPSGRLPFAGRDTS